MKRASTARRAIVSESKPPRRSRRPSLEPLEWRTLLTADWVKGIGVTGTSLNVGYNNLGGLAHSWPEILGIGGQALAVSGRLDFGPYSPAGGNGGGGRFAYNRALQDVPGGVGGTSDAVADVQAPGLAAEIAAGNVNIIVLEANHDFVNGHFAPIQVYADIYSGALAGPALDAYIDGRIANLSRAIDTLQAAGDVKIVAESYLDFGVSPFIKSNFPDPAGRQRVTAAVAAANVKYRAMTDARGIPMIDLDRFANFVASNSTTWTVGGVTLDRSAFDPPSESHVFIDGQHPGTVVQGLIANLVVAAIDGSYGADVAPLTDQEILRDAGITPSDGEPTYFDIRSFIRRVDRVAPASILVSLSGETGADGSYRGPVTVTVQAGDNRFGSGVENVEYSTDGGRTWIGAGEPPRASGARISRDGLDAAPAFSFSLWRPGTYDVLYRAVDAAGNVEAPHALAHSIRITAGLDATFGDGGRAVTDFLGSGIDVPAASAVQPDGKLVVAGTAFRNTRAIALARYNADGSLDTTFGVRGRATAVFGLDPTVLLEPEDVVRDVAVQADGKIVVVGAVDRTFALVRFDADGKLDTSFGDGGLVATSFAVPNPALSDSSLAGSHDFGIATGVVLRPDGTIVAVGQAGSMAYFGFSGDQSNAGIQASQLVAVRYTADGQLDASFGRGGKVQLDSIGKALHVRTAPNGLSRFYWHSVGMATDVALTPSGKIVIAGVEATYDPSLIPYPLVPGIASWTWIASRSIIQLNADGSLDDGFGTGGRVLHDNSDGAIDYGSVYNSTGDRSIEYFTRPGRAGGDLAIQPDGKIVFTDYDNRVGTDQVQFDRKHVNRLNPDGSPDLGFGSGGTVTTDTAAGADDWNGLVLQGDRIVVSDQFQLVRFLADGTLDATFGNGGAVDLPFVNGLPPHGSAGAGRGVALGPGGTLVALGFIESPPDATSSGMTDFALARFDEQGEVDSSFGAGGYVTTDVPVGGDNWAADIALQPDGKSVQLGTDFWDGFLELSRRNPDGSLDSTFGDGGRVTTAFSEGFVVASSLAIHGGSIVVAGTVYHADGTSALAVVRYNADGSLDTGLDGDGLLTIAVTGYDWASKVLVQPDGKIVVVGTAHDGAGTWNRWVLVRLNSNGSLDASFHGGTVVATLPGSSRSDRHVQLYAPYVENDAVLQSDGSGGWRVVVAGESDGDFALLRFRADGVMDATFGVGGIALTDIASGSDDTVRKVALAPDGKILVGGSASDAFALARYDADGHPDAGFGGGHGVVLADDSYLPRFRSLAVQPDGKIVATGEQPRVDGIENPSSTYAAIPITLIVARLNADGTPDTGFGTEVDGSGQPTGRVLYQNLLASRAVDPFGTPSTLAGLALQPDGRILVGGSDWQPGGGGFNFLLLRFEGGAPEVGPVPIVSQAQVTTTLTDLVAEANSSGQPVEVTLEVTTADPTQAAAQVHYVTTALATLPASAGATTTVILALASGVSYPTQTLSLPNGMQLVIMTDDAASLDHWTVKSGVVELQGDLNPIGWTVNGGTVTLNGVALSPGSPALTVNGGHVILTGVTTVGGSSPTILVTGGLLTIRNSTIQESVASSQAAIWVAGGVVDLGTATDPGGNTINVNGAGELVHNAGGAPVSAVGTAFTINAAPLATSSISGLVFKDFNDDGEIDFGELGIVGTTVSLDGTDFLGNSVHLDRPTDADGFYAFPNLLPGKYRITETQPRGYTQGINPIGSAGGTVTGDRFDLYLAAGLDALNYNYGERPSATATVGRGQTAGIGFWSNKNGQALIRALNGGSASTRLGDWLATTFPNLFGAGSGTSDLAGKDNGQVAAFYQSRFVLKSEKVDAQVLATALAVYVTSTALNPSGVGTQYGFIISGDGAGIATFNVGSNGDAFGVANNSVLTVLDLLLAVDAQTVGSVIAGGNSVRRTKIASVFGSINDAGKI